MKPSTCVLCERQSPENVFSFEDESHAIVVGVCSGHEIFERVKDVERKKWYMRDLTIFHIKEDLPLLEREVSE